MCRLSSLEAAEQLERLAGELQESADRLAVAGAAVAEVDPVLAVQVHRLALDRGRQARIVRELIALVGPTVVHRLGPG